MSEPMTAAERARAALPCRCYRDHVPFDVSCPAHYRPAVEQALSEAATAARVAERGRCRQIALAMRHDKDGGLHPARLLAAVDIAAAIAGVDDERQAPQS